jgi:hypothetical protein
MGHIGFTGFARSADPHGNVYYTRRRVNQAFLEALLEEFHKNGAKILERVGQEQPGTFLKVLGMLVPKELKIEHSNPASQLSDETLALMIGELESRIANRLSGGDAKLINTQTEPAVKEWIAPAPGTPYRKAKPKSSPRELEYAREYGRKRRKAAKAAKAARQTQPLSLAENER